MIISSSNHIFNQIRIQAGTWSFFWDHCFRSYNYDKQVSGTAIRITVQYHAPYHILLKVLDLFWIRTWYALSEVLWIYISLNIWPVLALTDKKINKVQPFFGCFPVSSYRTYKLKSLFDAWFIQIMIVIPWVCYHKMYFFYDFRRKAWRRCWCRCRCQIRINLIIWYIGRSNICCQRYNDRRRISITYQVKFVSKYPSSIVWLKPHFASVSISGHGTIPSFMDDVCQTLPFDLSKVLSIARMWGLTMSCETNRFPIVTILSLISLDTVFNLLSNVRLLDGSCKTDNPHAFITFLLYGRSTERKWWSDLFESSLNHMRTIKHRIMTVDGYM